LVSETSRAFCYASLPRRGKRGASDCCCRGGVVGQTLPRLVPETLPVFAGDTIVLATDGVHASSLDGTRTNDTMEGIANRVLATHARGTDDALVLVARYRGASP
jgi:negative regulator of sigma-B (phosphoserine phosphatase)